MVVARSENLLAASIGNVKDEAWKGRKDIGGRELGKDSW
jgi:hypothetical protein